jgi:hypothetical protein
VVPGSSRTVSTVALAGVTTNVVGFNDCQRLVLPNGSEYGPLVAIFAARTLSTILDSLRSQEGRATRRAFAAAALYSYDGSYPPLGIQPGFNCLYWDGVENLRATMVPVGYSDSSCLATPTADSLKGTELQVHRDPSQAGPPTVRWDWDGAHDLQYVGLGCEGAWCEIGSPGFESGTPWSTAPTAAEGEYDVQRLAIPGPDGSLIPGPARGTVFPAKGNHAESEYDGQWVTAAFVILSGPLPEYKRKSNFDFSASPGTGNAIAVCRGSEEECTGTRSFGTGQNWWERVVSALGDTAFRPVVFHDHRDVVEQGVALPLD